MQKSVVGNNHLRKVWKHIPSVEISTATLILNLVRVAGLGWPSRTLITKDPTSQSLLPVDDSAWDNGVLDLILPSNFILMYDDKQCR